MSLFPQKLNMKRCIPALFLLCMTLSGICASSSSDVTGIQTSTTQLAFTNTSPFTPEVVFNNPTGNFSPSNTVSDSSLKSQFYYKGKLVDVRKIGPGLPPENWQSNQDFSPFTGASTNILTARDVPALIWSYGCAPTAAAMYFGYYDRNGFPNMYTGLTNGGVFPLTNTMWGSSLEARGECPLSASHNGIDGRSIKGHVDDYYNVSGSKDDPYYGNWAEHIPKDSLADYMGTSQYQNWRNKDGTTSFYFNNDGSPSNDFTDLEASGVLDGTHGMKLFAESRGYRVTSNFNQYIYGYNNNTRGFTYNQYKAEIDAGNPVIIQLTNHSMIGVGYTGTNWITVHDTWSTSPKYLEWGGTYGEGNIHEGVSVIHLFPVADFTATPTSGTIPQTVFFYDTTRGNVTGWEWDFGDGDSTNATDKHPIHTYLHTGTFTVSLKINNPEGSNLTIKKEYITVSGSNITGSMMFRYNAAHTGDYSPVAGTTGTTVSKLWSYDIGGAGTSSPSVVDGMVYVGGKDDKIYALNATTGELKWSYTTGGFVISSPAVANGMVYAGSNDGNVYALDATTGALKWSYPAESSNPVVENGIVYVECDDGTVCALDATTGVFKWGYYTDRFLMSQPAVANGVVFVTNNEIYALDATTGALIWKNSTGVGGWPNPFIAPVVANGRVYVGCSYGLNGNGIQAFDVANGKPKLGIPNGSSSPAIANGMVYVVSSYYGNDLVFASDATTGEIIWSFPMIWVGSSTPTVANGVVYIGGGTYDKKVYALDATTGALIWNYTTGEGIESTPAIVNGIVYVGSDDGYLYALNTTGKTPTASFTATPTNGTAPLTVKFTDTSADLPSSWTWDFGDGSRIDATKQNPVHTYTEAGKYDVSLTVKNNVVNNTVTMSGYINVTSGSAPEVYFTAKSRSGPVPLTVYFTDYSGASPTSWAWNFGDGNTTNSTEQNPVHTYMSPGNYSVKLTATNAAGSNTKLQIDYIYVKSSRASMIGVFRNSTHLFYLDYNGNGVWNGAVTDRQYNFGISGDIPISGDWNLDGRTEIGVFRNSTHLFYLDYNGNGAWNGASVDRQLNFGISGDTPISGDWNSDGITEIGVFRNSTHLFYLDYNGNGIWNGASVDKQYNFGITGDIPVSGDWNNDRKSEIGVFRNSTHLFYLDYNGNGVWNGASVDRQYNFGITGDMMVTGDWKGDGYAAIGVFRPSTHLFYLDYNGNGAWNGASVDRQYNFGISGDKPVTGKW